MTARSPGSGNGLAAKSGRRPMSGLDSEQLGELEERVAALLGSHGRATTAVKETRPARSHNRVVGICPAEYHRGRLGRDLRHFATHYLSNHHQDHASYREGHCRIPPGSRGGQGCRPRPDGPGRRFPCAVLVLARSTGPMVGKARGRTSGPPRPGAGYPGWPAAGRRGCR